VKGAFTSAVTAKTGLFEAAAGGTLFIDEIGEMSMGSQAKLLRTLETHELRRVGSNEWIKIDGAHRRGNKPRLGP
jgi:transcriptional regulator with GAF, ATPase, and Fis domain